MAKKRKLKNNGKNKLNKVKNSSNHCRIKSPLIDDQPLENPDILLHRESQKDSILKWVKDKSADKKSSFMYIFGPPGTGKTFLLQSLTSKSIIPISNSRYFNCMQISTFKDLARHINKIICLKNLTYENKFKNIIFILDELQQSMIPQLLETFINKERSNVLLIIGVANCLSPHSLVQPENTIAFPPYTSNQLFDILMAKFSEFDDNFILELISKKVAGTCGDVRRALTLCKTVFESNLHLKDSPSEKRAKMLSIIYQSNQSSTSIDDSMPLQQKIIACAFLLDKEKASTLGKLYDEYCAICKQKMLPLIDFSTFRSSCELMASNGIIKLVENKNIRYTKVSLSVDESEIRRVFCENELFSSILNSC